MKRALLLMLLTGCVTRSVVLTPLDGGATGPDASVPLTDDLSAGLDHTCVVTRGVLSCAGANFDGALGTLDTMDRLTLSRASIAPDVVAISAGYSSTCALRARGSLLCFGANDHAQLGTGDFFPRTQPTEVFLTGRVASFSASFAHVCAILADGELFCWGSNLEGELGQGDAMPGDDRAVPVAVAPGTAFVEVSTGQGHTCAIAIDGALLCFGRNAGGELGLGDGSPGQVRTPTRVGTLRFRHVAAGQNHTCAIADDGALYCWGQDFDADGYAGPVGLPGAGSYATPTQVGDGHDWAAISTDTFHTCGLRAGGELWCWGRNAEGQLGVGDMSVVDGLVRVSPTETFTDVGVGRFHTCARRADGAVLSAGKNAAGELGMGDLERRASLTEVLGVE